MATGDDDFQLGKAEVFPTEIYISSDGKLIQNPTVLMGNAVFVHAMPASQVGWECPKCGIGVHPDVKVCPECQKSRKGHKSEIKE